MDERARTPAASSARAQLAARRSATSPTAAGVSIGTVSKALNNSGTLSAETRARIVRIAGELGFRPNDLAQALHRGQSFTVGLISNDSFGRFTLPILEGLERELADQRHRHLHVQRHRRSGARAPAHRAADAQAGRRPDLHRPPRRPAAGGLGAAARPAGALRLLAQRRSAFALPAARRRGRRPARDRAPRWRPAAAASPTSPAPSTSRPSACGATATAPRWPRPGSSRPTATS